MSLDVDDINPEDRGYINSIPADVRTPDEEAIRQQRADFMREKVALLKGISPVNRITLFRRIFI